MPRTALTCALALLALHSLAPTAAAQMTTERVASGLNDPVYVTAPPGDTERLFIVEQPGVIKILKNGTVLSRPFLDITDRVNNTFNEQGLLGLAFHPEYDDNGFFYVYYIGGSGAGISRLRRFTVSADPDSAVESSIFTIWSLGQPQSNHNGGHIEFDSDGYLYIGLGDGGGRDDPDENGQNGLTQLAAMLRIDVDHDDFPSETQNYAIPGDNPFVGNPNFLDEIWAYGLRNPYRWSFDRANGDLYIGDVGQECWEEIDYQPAASTGGENYGWNLTEGTRCFDPQDPNDCNQPQNCSAGLVDPIHEYDHDQDVFSCSVTGGYVYRGSAIPNMQGHYFYADYCSRQIYTFRYDGAVQELTNRTSELAPGGGQTISNIVGFGEDGDGELYIVELSSFNGEVYKIIPDPSATDSATPIGRPGSFQLSGAFPNPFTEITHFELALSRRTDVEVSVFSAAGRLVRQLHRGEAEAGTFPVAWNGRDAEGAALPSGVYFLRAQGQGQVSTKRVTLLR